jgi:hypothetical protein
MTEKKSQLKKPALIGMILNPNEQFKRIQINPIIWYPLIILSLISMVVTILVAINIDYIPSFGMTEKDIEVAKMVGTIVGALGTLIGLPVGYVLFAVILWGIAKKAKSTVTFKQMFSLIIFISFIRVIGQSINQMILVAINGDQDHLLTSLNYFVGAKGVLGEILGVIELFSIWYYILLSIGLIKIAKLSNRMSISISIIFFCLLLILASVQGAIEEYHFEHIIGGE